MRATKNSPRRWGGLVLALLLALGLAPLAAPPVYAQQTQPRTMANLVVFVRLAGDTANDFDCVKDMSGYQQDNWQTIRNAYDGGDTLYPEFDNSFSGYIRTVSQGAVEIKNIFPQEYIRADGSKGVQVLTLSQVTYESGVNGGDEALIDEVVQRLEAAQSDQNDPLYIDPSIKLDNCEAGVLDNLTIVLQGTTFNGKDRSYKANYAGDHTIRGIKVSNYNAIPSVNLIDTTLADGSVQMGGFAGQGVISHEFLHTLGLPDLYRANGSGVPVGRWDVMGQVARIPQYPLGWQRLQLGWLSSQQVMEITQSGTYTLTAVSKEGGYKLFTLHTPLPESSYETICLEYRKRDDNTFERNLYDEGGLLMYRVNQAVADKTNIAGGNYIYVYRPGVTDPEAAADVVPWGSTTENGVCKAALKAGDSYGSLDLSAGFEQKTLYYSGGANSGIVIENVELSGNGDQITFDVRFADYDTNWQPAGAAVQDARLFRLYADEATDRLYMACLQASDGKVVVYCWQQADNSWQPLEDTGVYGKSAAAPVLTACGDLLYLAYVGADDQPCYLTWDGSQWGTPVTIPGGGYSNYLQLASDDTSVYAAYQKSKGADCCMAIVNLKTRAVVESPVTAQDFCNPTLLKNGTKLYLAYARFMGKDPAKIDVYDTATGQWSNAYTYQSSAGKFNLLQSQGECLYALTGGQQAGDTILAVWDGNSWREYPVQSAPQNYLSATMALAGRTVYLAFYDNTAKTVQMLRFSNGKFEPCYTGLNGEYNDFQLADLGLTVYAAGQVANTDTVTVRSQTVTDDTDPVQPEDPAAKLLLRLTPPAPQTAGLQTDGVIHLDGVAHTATPQGEGYTLQLPNTAAQTAVMYYYDKNGIPKGMAVWRLEYPQGRCTATLLTGLQDLISYHGFSIRVQGVSGLRFKSGLDAALRARLLSDGVDGLCMVECGTLSMIGSRQQAGDPFVKGAAGVKCGRAYWTENGQTNDHIFETVAGRHRFTSVLIGVPAEQYDTAVAFRGYVILRAADGQLLTVYGPPVVRSIYTVAKQVMADGDFKPGSSAYIYVQGIIDAVEKGGNQ